jgi:hypothetical protein
MLHSIRALSLVGTIVTSALIAFFQVYLAVAPGLSSGLRLWLLLASGIFAAVAIVSAICLAICDKKLYSESHRQVAESQAHTLEFSLRIDTLNESILKNLVAPGSLIYRALRLVANLNAIVESFLEKLGPLSSNSYALNELRGNPSAAAQYEAQYGITSEGINAQIYALEQETIRRFREGGYQAELQNIVREFADAGIRDEFLSAFAGLQADEPWTVRNYRDGLNRLIAAYASRS